MPNLRNNPKTGGQIKRNGEHSKADLLKTERQEFARDDLKGAFAGKQNEKGAAGSKTTHLNARRDKRSENKTPKR